MRVTFISEVCFTAVIVGIGRIEFQLRIRKISQFGPVERAKVRRVAYP